MSTRSKVRKIDPSATNLDNNNVEKTKNSTNGNSKPQIKQSKTGKIDEDKDLTKEEILDLRKKVLVPACTVFYKDDPLMVDHASKQYLFDENGDRYLDCISNVQHVGHCHPSVIEAVTKQMSKTNCNSRFVNQQIVKCARRILATLPPELDKIFFVNSGSEANDLALRIARDFTGGYDVIVVDHAYHGHLTTTMDMSPYKFSSKTGKGKPDHTYVAPCPDVYRGTRQLPDNLLEDPKALAEKGRAYADDVKTLIEDAATNGRPKIAAFVMESLQSCGGQVIPPPGYLENVIKHMHEAGGIVICDEVQTGFGRVGEKFWAFQLQGEGVVPDIVTMGKPMGNGFPVSAVACRHELAETLGHGLEYFNTFGGNPVSCAAALAVMDVIQEEKLQENAKEVGAYMLAEAKKLQKKYPTLIGDVRGVGLFVGIDLITDRQKRTPASDEAKKIIMSMKRKRVCLSSEGPYGNIIKIKPPICFSKENVDEMISKLDETIRTEIMKNSKSEISTMASNSEDDAIEVTAAASLDIQVGNGEQNGLKKNRRGKK